MRLSNEFVEKYLGFTQKRINKLRLQKNDSAAKMSQYIGLNDAYVSRIESNERTPSLEALFAICDFLGVTPHEFFDENNPDPPIIKAIVENLKLLSDEGRASILSITNGLAGNK